MSHALLFTLVAILNGAAPDLADWPQWRGPTRDGRVPGKNWPDTLDKDRLQLVWRVKLGPSYSGPIVAGDRVFVTETENRASEVVRALDRQSGKELWQARWKGALTVPFFARANGDWIRATPAFDGDSLYVAGMRDVLVCLDASKGTERWRLDFVEKYKTSVPAFGFVASPLVDGDNVYVQAGAAIVKIDKKSGKVLWRSAEERGSMMDSAFSSPVLAELAGKKQLVAQTRAKLVGLDLDKGEVLWSQAVPAFRGMNILTPTIQGNGLFTSCYGGKSYLFRITRDSDKLACAEAWTNKAQGYMSSPVFVDDHVYMHLRNQRFTCIHLPTGKDKWTTKETFGRYWSMIVQDKKILALDENGTLRLIRANPEKYEPLDSRIISEEETWAHLAASGDQVFIRELNAMAVYRWR